MPIKGFQGVVGLTMFLFLSNYVSRKVGPSHVRAFSSGTRALARRGSLTNKVYGSRMASLLTEDSRKYRGICYSTTTALRSAVEQDLDSALDDLLQGTFDDVDDVEEVEEVEESVSSLSDEEVSLTIAEFLNLFCNACDACAFSITLTFSFFQFSFLRITGRAN